MPIGSSVSSMILLNQGFARRMNSCCETLGFYSLETVSQKQGSVTKFLFSTQRNIPCLFYSLTLPEGLLENKLYHTKALLPWEAACTPVHCAAFQLTELNVWGLAGDKHTLASFENKPVDLSRQEVVSRLLVRFSASQLLFDSDDLCHAAGYIRKYKDRRAPA